MLSTLVLIISICFLMYFAYRGFSVLVIAPAIALFAVFLSNDGHVLASFTQIYMPKVGGFIISYFPIFLLSAVFGKLMEHSGSAKVIAEFITKTVGAERSVLATVISCSILTYGGISLFVVAFAIYPIAVELFSRSDIPKRLIPGAIALGAFSYTMTALPGSTAIQNAIPGQYFGTDTFAAPGIGIIVTLIIFSLGMLFINHQVKVAKQNGENFGQDDDHKKIRIHNESFTQVITAFSPIVIVTAVNYICVKYIFNHIDTSYLSNSKYGSTDISSVGSNWGIIVGLFVSVLFMIIVHAKKYGKIAHILNRGANDSLCPIFNTAAVVGYGAIVSHMKGFEIIKNFITNLFPNMPTISCSFVTAIMCAITGSASGGLTISLENMINAYMKIAEQANISTELLHRIICISSGVMDTMPHNGAVVTLLAVCGLTYRESYKDILIVSCVFPLIALSVAIVLGEIFGAF